jgi:hypothetical protein
MERVLPPEREATSRHLKTLSEVRHKMEKAAVMDELTEALCLLPPVQRSFASSMSSLRDRLALLPEPLEEPPAAQIEIPEPVEFPPIDDARRVPIHVVGWFSGAVALSLMVSFVLGYMAGRS